MEVFRTRSWSSLAFLVLTISSPSTIKIVCELKFFTNKWDTEPCSETSEIKALLFFKASGRHRYFSLVCIVE
ncbi:MAG: hypothetical protein QGG44_07855, partial [Alphaproteobacteria bacterium]|nr:hypothetical protein [Alphaproteobacteria bacterium]